MAPNPASMPTDHSPSDHHLTVLAPVRNEEHSIEAFLDAVKSTLDGHDFSWDIVLADDSDDETPALIEAARNRGEPVTCVHREPGSRFGSIAGAIQGALDHANGPYVAVIDSDLQHPPAVLLPMFEALASGEAQVTVGTRYAGGGSAIGLGTRWRRFASVFAGWIIRVSLPHLWHCTDLSSGLFGFDKRLMKAEAIDTEGFKVLTEVILATDASRIVEVPYVFRNRGGGVSKARLRDGMILVRQLVNQRKRCRRFWPIEVKLADTAVDTGTKSLEHS